MVLNLLTAAGAAAVASNDSDMGSSNCNRPSTVRRDGKVHYRRTINFDLVFWSEYSLFAIMHSSRWVNEVNDIRMIIVGGE